MTSRAVRLASLPQPDREKVLSKLTDEEKDVLLQDWEFWARPEQLPPPEPWSVVWYSGGRRSGKTRAGAECAAQLAKDHPNIDGAIIAPTFQADAVRKCIESESGILKALGGVNGPHVKDYNRGEGVIYLRSGRSIMATGAKEGAPHIQGENLGWAWCDEVGLWARTMWRKAWEESIKFAVAMAPAKILCTGTPKAGHPLVKMLEQDPQVVKVRLRTIDNIDFLDPETIFGLIAKYEGTRLGAQELEGILIQEVEGALWTWANIETYRWKGKAPTFLRIVVGVDPSGGANEIGIVAAGIIKSPCPCGGQNEKGPHFGVIQDNSLIGSPERWGAVAVGTYAELEADRVVAEKNFGGDMVESTLRVADPKVPVTMVTASRGKQQRAEPISALYEQGRVHHMEVLSDLETELTTWVPGDDWSPNRLDAGVWALTDLADRGTPRRQTQLNPARRTLYTPQLDT